MTRRVAVAAVPVNVFATPGLVDGQRYTIELVIDSAGGAVARYVEAEDAPAADQDYFHSIAEGEKVTGWKTPPFSTLDDGSPSEGLWFWIPGGAGILAVTPAPPVWHRERFPVA